METQKTNSLLSQFNTAKTGRNSFLISFEGIEGSGKSTQIQLLKGFLNSKGYNITILREPGGTIFGEGLRQSILNSNQPLHPLAEAHLFASSRTQLLFERILPTLLKDNEIVILDRYIDSSLAYQGEARKLSIPRILNLHIDPPLNTLPHLTLYLRISLELSIERQSIRNTTKDYFEKENKDFYQSLVDGFDHCAEIFPKRIKTINASKDISSVEEQVQSVILKLISHQ